MPPSLQPGLINGPAGDPGLLVSFAFDRRSIAFDLGDIAPLSPRDVLKLTHIFVSHAHMDHFIGFDRLLRIALGRSKSLYFYGPEGFLGNMEGKLAGYVWNLAASFTHPFIIHATEITETGQLTRRYACGDGFQPIPDPAPLPPCPVPMSPSLTTLYREPSFEVVAAVLDHGIPCLGFSLKENFRVNIRKERLDALGWTPGPWLHQFKQAIYDGLDPETLFPVPVDANHPDRKQCFALQGLLADIAIIGSGRKIVYITDAAYHCANVEKMIALAKHADHLFIEAAFLEKDKEHAVKKRHLTARQAGEIAGLAGARRFSLFHFSPRYQGAEKLFYAEAVAAYQQVFKGIPGTPGA